MTRREFIAYSASGLLGLLLGGTGAGYGWLQSHEKAENLSTMVTNVNSDVGGLSETIDELQGIIQVCKGALSDYLNIYPQTIYSIAYLNDNITKTKSLYGQLDETGMTIAEIIEFVVNLLSFVPDTEIYTKPVNAMLDAVKNIPDTILLTEQALEILNVWFSEEPNQGINNRLLFPTQTVFHTIDNDIKMKIESLQDRLTDM